MRIDLTKVERVMANFMTGFLVGVVIVAAHDYVTKPDGWARKGVACIKAWVEQLATRK